MSSIEKTQDLKGNISLDELTEMDTKIWDVLGFIGYARFLCKWGKWQKAASELHEAINLLKGVPLDGHIGSLLVEASDNLQEAIDCLENVHISEAIRIMDSASAALKMAAKKLADIIGKKIGGELQ